MTDRELLMEFVEFCDETKVGRIKRPPRYMIDAFLAQHAADLTPAPAEVATIVHSGDERQSLQNVQQLDSLAASVSTDGETAGRVKGLSLLVEPLQILARRGEAVTEYRTTEPDGMRRTLCLVDVPPPSLNQRVTVIIHGDSPTTVEFVAVGVTTKRRIAYGVEYQGQDSVVELRQVKREALP